jgi:hypothetical protein
MLSRGELQKPKKAAAEDKKATVTVWLRDNYIKYLNRTCELLSVPEAGLQIPALKIMLDLVKLESAHVTSLSGNHYFANDLYNRITDALLNCSNMSPPLLNEFTEKYFGFYDDLRFYFLKNTTTIINAALGIQIKKDTKAQQNKVKQERRTYWSMPKEDWMMEALIPDAIVLRSALLETEGQQPGTTGKVGSALGKLFCHHGDSKVHADRSKGA